MYKLAHVSMNASRFQSQGVFDKLVVQERSWQVLMLE